MAMLPEHAELSTYDFEPSSAALARMLAAGACEVCGVEPLDARRLQGPSLAWLQRFRPALADEFKNSVIAAAEEGEPEHHIWYGGGTLETQMRRLRWDTRSEPTVALDVDVLDRVVARLSLEQWSFVEDRLALTACAACRNTGSENDGTAAFALSRYVAIHFDGERSVAEAQPSWPLARSVFDILADIDLRMSQAG